MRAAACLLAVSGAAMCAAAHDAGEAQQLPAEVYARAERFLPWNADEYALNATIEPHWIGATDQFWYRRQTKAGKEFLIVEAASGKRRAAFDHAVLARGLSAALGKPVEPQDLPFESFELLEGTGSGSIEIRLDQERWHCSLTEARCSAAGSVQESGDVLSPDGKWAAFLKGQDLWVRSLRDQSERALTRDGEEHYGYGSFAGSGAALGFRRRTQKWPVVLWSPDSRKLLTHRLDERKVLDMHLLEFAPADSVRPVLHSYRFALPADENKPTAQLVIFDVASGERTDVSHPPMPVTVVGPILDDRAWWSEDSRTLYIVPREEGQQRVQLLAVNADTGATRQLIEERSETYVEIGGSVTDRAVRTLSDGRILWYSERDDWGHLYLYGRNGKLVRQLTSGPWKVMEVVRVDESKGRMFFTAVGREADEDPYQRHLYAIALDGSGLRLLTPENADHDIRSASPRIEQNLRPGAPSASQASFSPSGRYFVDTYSRPDLPSTTVLRRADGSLVATLERADISALQAGGLTLPEPFSVLAADGLTRLYGTIFRPSRFDPAARYPVIDVIYPGPQSTVTAKSFAGAVFDVNQALAELGFIVVNIDGRGTPFRSKSFHDASYGKLAEAGNLEDHIAAIRQLAGRYAYLDLQRVGITGVSGGGFASTRAILAYPDFYKVAVSISGNHDQRGYLLVWGPTYQGPYQSGNYDAQINARLADRLKGKLFLMHGDMDDNVHPALTMQVVDALIEANKDFDFLLLPGQDHGLRGASGYVERRRWDYLVRNLLGVQPPANYPMFTPPRKPHR